MPSSTKARTSADSAVSAQEVHAAARELLPWMVEIRRDLHQHPELGLEEHRTAGRVQTLLDEIGIEHIDGIGGTGVLGHIRGASAAVEAGLAVALRADLDALPLHDGKDVPYRSTVPGKMHACGHDVHTTVLLGAARILHGLGERVPGRVKLLFQPAEETVGGAELLIEAGALEDPPVAGIFGLHVDNGYEVGHFGVRYGQRNAASDSIHLTIHGSSCHGAYPSNGVDAIVIAAQVVTAVQTLVSRNVDARESAVVTFGTIHGGTIANVVANEVQLAGTVRTLSPDVRTRVLGRLRETVEGVAAAMGGSATLKIEPGYDPLINADAMVDLVRTNAEALVGEARVRLRPKPNMGVEDFAFYLNHAPGAFFTLGTGNKAAGIVHSVHQELFDVDEECLAFGAAIQVLNAVRALEQAAR